jgi:transcriptional regulator with XRE-family HTH domain
MVSDEAKQKFGERLSAARKKRGLTQSQFAQQMNTERSTLAHWEIGRRLPSIDDIPKICRILEISCTELLEVFSDEISEF